MLSDRSKSILLVVIYSGQRHPRVVFWTPSSFSSAAAEARLKLYVKEIRGRWRENTLWFQIGLCYNFSIVGHKTIGDHGPCWLELP